MRRLIAVVLLLGVLVGAAVLYSIYAASGSLGQPVYVDFEKGTTAREMAGELAKDGVIGSPWQFLVVRALRPKARLQAGEYEFKGGQSPWTVFDRIVRGDVFYYELTVTEGSNIFDIGALLDGLGVIGSKQFLAAARNTQLIRDMDPQARTLDG